VKKIVVLGAGISGLASAALLAAAGHQVTVLEANSWVGGKSRRIKLAGQRLDTGPALVTFPEVWQEFLTRFEALTGKKVSEKDRLEFVKLQEVGRYFFRGDVTDLPVQKDHKWFAAWQQFEADHKPLTASISKLLTASPLNPKALPAVLKMALVYGKNLTTESYLNSLRWLPEGLREVIAIHTLNAGVAPSKTLALYASMTAAMATEGISVPVGGVNEIPQSLYRLAKRAGVEVHLNERVTRVEKNRAHTANKVFDFDLVVSSLDPQQLDLLLGKKKQMFSKPRSCSGVAIYAVLEKPLPKGTVTHSVIMPDEPNELYAALEQFLPPRQTMAFLNYYKPNEIYPNSKPTVAVLLTAPADGKKYDLESPWVINEIKRISSLIGLKKPITEIFEDYKILTPKYFSEWGGYGGALYGDTRKFWQSGPFHKPSYVSGSKPWLWRVGASVHPGGGIPAVLGGSLIVTEQLLKFIQSSDSSGSSGDAVILAS
jgi:phytoene desaturase